MDINGCTAAVVSHVTVKIPYAPGSNDAGENLPGSVSCAVRDGTGQQGEQGLPDAPQGRCVMEIRIHAALSVPLTRRYALAYTEA